MPTGLRIAVGAEKTFDHGALSAIGATALRIVSTYTFVARGVQIKAAVGNSGLVYVGNADVTAGSADATDGFELSPGDGLFVPAYDLSRVWFIGDSPGQKIFWFTVG